MRGGGRLSNLALLCLLTLAFFSGWVAFELSGQPARATLVIHAAAGVAIVLLVPWKALVARRGLRRPRALRWASLVLALGVVISLVFGFLHSFGRPDVGYLTAIDFHVGAAICVVPFVIWHVLARPSKLRRADLSRRNFLKGGALIGASLLGVAALPAPRRAPRGRPRAELERGRILVGSPATVRERLREYVGTSGANYVLGCFAFGSLPVEQVLSSVDLFAREVMPALSRTAVAN